MMSVPPTTSSFLPDEDRHTYAGGLRRGGYLVSVHAGDADYERVIDILDERSSSWRAEGWTGTSDVGTSDVLSGSTANLTTGTSAMSGTTTSTGGGVGAGSMNTASQRTTAGDEVIPIAEEELHVGKRDVSHGRVRIRSYVVEQPVSEQVNLREEHVAVERRPVSGATQAGMLGGDPFQERTIEVEERAEEAMVSKEAGQRTETISDTVRRTEVDVEDERSTGVSRTGTTDRKP